MPSTRRILEVYLQSVLLYETGDRKVPQAQNTIVGLLNYPRPGRAEVMATTGLLPGISDGKTLRFRPPRLFLKEIVQGPTELILTVTDRDDRNRVVSFLRQLGASVFGSAGEAAGALVPGLLRAAFQEAVVSGRLAIGEKNDEKIEVVATGFLRIADLDPDASKKERTFIVDLEAPRELQRSGKPPIKSGSSNGHVELLLELRQP